jgi:hypothetical protein
MKKLFILLFAFVGTLFMTSCGIDIQPSGREIAEQSQQTMEKTAVNSVEIPVVSYFQERRTIAKWAKRWDKPSIATYVYLISFGKIIGYYVADGKPASTRSYLLPEEKYEYHSEGGVTLGTPDIDGTYGDNNPGIRFFTAEGVAVEWGGDGASYLYSDAPLPIDVPKLNVRK